MEPNMVSALWLMVLVPQTKTSFGICSTAYLVFHQKFPTRVLIRHQKWRTKLFEMPVRQSQIKPSANLIRTKTSANGHASLSKPKDQAAKDPIYWLTTLWKQVKLTLNVVSSALSITIAKPSRWNVWCKEQEQPIANSIDLDANTNTEDHTMIGISTLQRTLKIQARHLCLVLTRNQRYRISISWTAARPSTNKTNANRFHHYCISISRVSTTELSNWKEKKICSSAFTPALKSHLAMRSERSRTSHRAAYSTERIPISWWTTKISMPLESQMRWENQSCASGRKSMEWSIKKEDALRMIWLAQSRQTKSIQLRSATNSARMMFLRLERLVPCLRLGGVMARITVNAIYWKEHARRVQMWAMTYGSLLQDSLPTSQLCVLIWHLTWPKEPREICVLQSTFQQLARVILSVSGIQVLNKLKTSHVLKLSSSSSEMTSQIKM